MYNTFIYCHVKDPTFSIILALLEFVYDIKKKHFLMKVKKEKGGLTIMTVFIILLPQYCTVIQQVHKRDQMKKLKSN